MEKKTISITPDTDISESIKSAIMSLMEENGIDPKNSNIRIVNLDDAKNELQELNKQVLPVTEVANVKDCKPAVMYDTFNVYTPNGMVSVPAAAYDTLFAINRDIIGSLNKPTPDTMGMFSNIISNITYSNLCNVADNFLATIANIYDVFIARLNQFFITEKGEVVFAFEPHYGNISTASFEAGIGSFLNTTPAGRTDIINKYLIDFAITYVNSIGSAIYNDIRGQISPLISSENIPEEGIHNFFKELDRTFSKMMMDMNYETSVFAYNLSITSEFIPSSESMNRFLEEK